MEQKKNMGSLEMKLQQAEQKRLEAEEKEKTKDDENKMLNRQLDALRSRFLTHTQDLVTSDQDSIHQLEKVVSKMGIN
jgi:hypothetical protein